MKIKLIAIGSRIMSDDGIAIKVAENFWEIFSEQEIEVIIGETDVAYCLSKIAENDLIFILDSTSFGVKPGTISVVPLNEMGKYSTGSLATQHSLNLVTALYTYLQSTVMGFLIGIEVEKVQLGVDLSTTLENSFMDICSKVYEQIRTLLEFLRRE